MSSLVGLHVLNCELFGGRSHGTPEEPNRPVGPTEPNPRLSNNLALSVLPCCGGESPSNEIDSGLPAPPGAPYDGPRPPGIGCIACRSEHAVAFKLRGRAVHVAAVTEQADDTPAGKIMEAIMESVDEFQSENLAQEVTRRMRGQRPEASEFARHREGAAGAYDAPRHR